MTNYWMFTPEGDAAVEVAMRALVLRAESGEIGRRTLPREVQAAQQAVAAVGYGEVFDTEVEWAITDVVNERICKPLQWVTFDRWEM